MVLVNVPKFGYYFEAEITTDQKFIQKANQKIVSICDELSLIIFDYKGLSKLLENLNNRPGFRFNFKKQKFSDIKKRFKDYF